MSLAKLPADKIREHVGATIRRWRKRTGDMSRRELAEKVAVKTGGCVDRTIQRWEEGVTAPDAVDLVVLADIFGCMVAELFA